MSGYLKLRIAGLHAAKKHLRAVGQETGTKEDTHGKAAITDRVRQARGDLAEAYRLQLEPIRILKMKILAKLSEIESNSTMQNASGLRFPETSDGFLSSKQLAEKHGVPVNSLRRRLERWHKEHPELAGKKFAEIADREGRGAKWIYLESVVRDIILDLQQNPQKRPRNK
jgi:hypothetical protein